MSITNVRSLILLPVFLLAAQPMARRDDMLQPQPSLAGTYHIAVCKRQPCATDDTTNVVVSGTVVLSDTTFTDAAFPDSLQFALRKFTRLGPRNGCTATAARRSGAGTFAALGGVELIAWTREQPNRVAFELHQSDNAAYRVQLEFTGERFRGSGKSFTTGSVAPTYPDDIVVGRKLGPPDHTQCADS